jgi:hypothetical protein
MPITRIVGEKWETVDGKYQKVAEAYPETFAHGKTLSVGTRTVQIMSDVWGTAKEATYWDDASAQPKTVTLDICDYRYEHGDKVHAEVDATEEVYAALRAHLFQKALAERLAQAERVANEIKKDSTVEIVSGRQGKGTKGRVVVAIERPYNMGWKSSTCTKLGIATSDRKVKVAGRNGKVYENYAEVVWAWIHNCKLIDVPAVDTKEAEDFAVESADAQLAAWRCKAA